MQQVHLPNLDVGGLPGLKLCNQAFYRRLIGFFQIHVEYTETLAVLEMGISITVTIQYRQVVVQQSRGTVNTPMNNKNQHNVHIATFPYFSAPVVASFTRLSQSSAVSPALARSSKGMWYKRPFLQ